MTGTGGCGAIPGAPLVWARPAKPEKNKVAQAMAKTRRIILAQMVAYSRPSDEHEMAGDFRGFRRTAAVCAAPAAAAMFARTRLGLFGRAAAGPADTAAIPWTEFFTPTLSGRRGIGVAQVSKPAVSPISKSAGRRTRGDVRRFRNLRYSRLGSLRYKIDSKISGFAARKSHIVHRKS